MTLSAQRKKTVSGPESYLHHVERIYGEELHDAVLDAEYIIRDKVGEGRFNRLKDEYEKYISNHPQKEDICKKLIISDDVIIHVQGLYPNGDLEGIPSSHITYYPICTKQEIERIATPKTTDDILLTIRANATEHNMRIRRVLLARYNKNPADWTLTSYFKDAEFKHYLSHLTPNERSKCNITAGFAFTKEPNGACIKSRLGSYIVISEALKHFLYFMNIFILGHEDVSPADRMTSLLIAARIMFYYEMLDFDLDPRGKLPAKLEKQIQNVIKYQMQFVIGHEYYHHILGHLNENDLTETSFKAVVPTESEGVLKVYNPSQLNEFEADFAAIHRPNFSKTFRSDVLTAAILFFMALDIYSLVKDYYSPSASSFKTHPAPLDRLWALRNKMSPKFGMPSEDIRQFLSNHQVVKDHLLKEYLPFNADEFEMQGSYYLSSYEQGAALDRIHY